MGTFQRLYKINNAYGKRILKGKMARGFTVVLYGIKCTTSQAQNTGNT
jgi:hypothetical protein